MRRVVIASFAIALATSLSACGGSSEKSSDSSADPSATSAAAASANTDPSVEIAYTYFNDDPFLRFAAEVTNPGDKARVGITVSWKALDKDGVIVGTYESTIPVVPAESSTFYVGGAGAAWLDGTPAQVEIEITDEGGTVDSFEPAVTASDEKFEKSEYSFTPGTTDFDASATIEAHEDVASEDLYVTFVLRDKAGKIIGAEWGDTDSVPETLASGEKAKVTASVGVQDGTPASLEVYAGAK